MLSPSTQGSGCGERWTRGRFVAAVHVCPSSLGAEAGQVSPAAATRRARAARAPGRSRAARARRTGAGHGTAPTRHLWWACSAGSGSAWEALNSSYWFLPAALGLGAFLLSMATLSVDRRLPQDWLLRLDLDVLPVIQSEGARSVLTTVASSMITVAGVVFSLTLLVLTQASSQFGPRLLSNFMRDRTNQFVLGIFVATFVYALLVLRVVTGGDGEAGIDAFVPHLSVMVALVLTFFTVAVLVYFFHHIAQSIRVTHVLADVDDALRRRLEALAEIRTTDGGDREDPEEARWPSRSTSATTSACRRETRRVPAVRRRRRAGGARSPPSRRRTSRTPRRRAAA
jgi:hypothetical protein